MKEIIDEINSHNELFAGVNYAGNLIEVTKVDDSKIGNELIADYIERIVGTAVASKIRFVKSDEASSVCWYEVKS